MKKFLLFVFAAVFISNSSNAYHHEGNHRDDVRRENGFYDEYHEGYGRNSMRHERRVNMMHDDKERISNKRFKLQKGAPSKKRKYNKHQLHEQKMRHMKKRLEKLPKEKRDAALKEIERHHHEMGNIIGDDKRFPEFRGKGIKKDTSPQTTKVKVDPMPKVKPISKKNKPIPSKSKMKQNSAVAPKSTSTSPSAPIPTNNSDQKNESRNIDVKWKYPKKLV